MQPLPTSLVWPTRFLLTLVLLVVVQLIAMPTSVWQMLGERSLIGEGWGIFETVPMFEQISVAPARTVTAAFYFLIPISIVVLVYRLGWRAATTYLPWTISGIGAASALLGLMQVLLPATPELYFYVYTNQGAPVGFFANVNNHAIFLLMTMAFTSVLLSGFFSTRQRTDHQTGLLLFAGGLGGLQLLGVLAAGSVAGYLLLVPVLGLCALIMQSQKRLFNPMPLLIGTLILIPSVLLIAHSPLLSGLGTTVITNEGPMSRLGLAEVGLEVFWDHFLLGTGLGTFEPVFKAYEDPETVSLTYANHVHNDYLQWAIETGIVGFSLLLAALIWLVRQMFRAWQMTAYPTRRMRRAAATAALVPILHSLIEYPLRTPSTLALASLCIALMILPRELSRKSRTVESASREL
ncbi:MAG: O-antigen ligase family protein [Pseudomonadota bacterium]